MKAGFPPPLASEYASIDAVVMDAQPEDFSLRWSPDGESIALLRKEKPLAMIVSRWKRGHSTALSKSGPYGEPWDEELFRATFKT